MFPLMVLAVIAVIAVLVLFWGVAAHNRLLALRNEARHAWSAVEVQLQRRSDLVPQLVEAVAGHAAHERDSIAAVTRARTRAVEADRVGARANAESDLSQALFDLRTVAEAYPQLKGEDGFARLQAEVTAIDDRIASARGHYNTVVDAYDRKRDTVPGNLVAELGEFPRHDRFEADADSRTPVRVQS